MAFPLLPAERKREGHSQFSPHAPHCPAGGLTGLPPPGSPQPLVHAEARGEDGQQPPYLDVLIKQNVAMAAQASGLAASRALPRSRPGLSGSGASALNEDAGSS